jgi:GTP cyclohydrolase I
VGNARVLRQLQRGLSPIGPPKAAHHRSLASRGLKSRAPHAPEPEAMRRAVRDFLQGSGLDPDDPELRDTPARVAEAWVQHFLDGYERDPAQVLSERIPVPDGSRGELVVVTGLRFHSMCPHHLLPVEGRAHLAYVPGKWMVGFGRLAALLNTWAHRLILQEALARGVARSLAEHLGSTASACIVEAHQACLRVRGEEQPDAVTHAEAYEGALRKDGMLRRELWSRIGAATTAREGR